MKTQEHNRFGLLLLFLLGATLLTRSLPATAQTDNGNTRVPPEVMKNWSLFSEYHKNQDYRTAIPYGWTVVELSPARFKSLYEKLAECYIKIAEGVDSLTRPLYGDSVIIVYDLGIKSIPERASYYQIQKGFTFERYFLDRDSAAIESYAQGINADFATVDFYYIDRLGVLYIKNIPNNPDNKLKAVDLFRKYLDRDPNNGVALDRLKKIIDDPKELIDISLQKLKTDPENIAFIWSVVQAYVQSEDLEGAIPYIERLVKKEPHSETYLNELGKTNQKAGRYRDAISAYERSLKLYPDSKENLLNIALCYRELNNYSAARTYAQRAAAKDKSWGRPYIEIAQVLESNVADCVLNTKGGWTNMKLDDRLVYKLAQEYYARARAIDPKLASEADVRSRNLETLVPQQEDYFFNKDKIRDGKIAIFGSCYEWIGESITVPTKSGGR